MEVKYLLWKFKTMKNTNFEEKGMTYMSVQVAIYLLRKN